MEALVIATNRPNSFRTWLKAWRNQISENGIRLYVMVDTFDAEITKEIRSLVANMGEVFDHNDVVIDLKQNAWIIPQKSCACKSYAIYRAWKDNADRVFCLDDDCMPKSGVSWFGEHRRKLSSRANNSLFRTIYGVRPRGIPYQEDRPIVLSHGLWSVIPDVDAVTQMTGFGKPTFIDGTIPQGALFPFCGMNWACNREIIPLMYFAPNWKVDRFDDIWCGFIAKKILDHLGYAVLSGEPLINHVRASDPLVNIEKEAAGYRMNRDFYQFISKLSPLPKHEDTPMRAIEYMGCIIEGRPDYPDKAIEGQYWKKYGEALQIWASLFEEE